MQIVGITIVGVTTYADCVAQWVVMVLTMNSFAIGHFRAWGPNWWSSLGLPIFSCAACTPPLAVPHDHAQGYHPAGLRVSRVTGPNQHMGAPDSAHACKAGASVKDPSPQVLFF